MLTKQHRWTVGVTALGLLCLGSVSCMALGDGALVVKSAPRPTGWPSLTPVGTIEVKTYPAYREARASREDLDRTSRDLSGSLFMVLFEHIKREQIAMTAPVKMTYIVDQRDVDAASETDTAAWSVAQDDAQQVSFRLAGMSFLYRTTDLGTTGDTGRVEVRDVEEQDYASLGVRGDYTDERFKAALQSLLAWIDERSEQYEIIGLPRYLGYNGPFTPSFLRYGEVQVPVKSLGSEVEASEGEADDGGAAPARVEG